jgi:hypothetical protein
MMGTVSVLSRSKVEPQGLRAAMRAQRILRISAELVQARPPASSRRPLANG